VAGPEPLSVTDAVRTPPAPAKNEGAGAQVSVGGVASIFSDVLTGISLSPAASTLAA
jgi:hypothetical protein